MFDVSRYRGVAAAMMAVALGLALCSLVARAALRDRPFWLPPGDSTMEGGQAAVVGRRISGVIAEQKRRGKTLADLDLGVILGASAVSMAVEPAILEASGDRRIPTHWLSLYANGANLSDLRGLADLVFVSGLRPRLFLLGIHPALLARSDNYLSDDTVLNTQPLRKALADHRVRDAKDELLMVLAVPLNQAFPQRTRVGHGARVAIIEAKRRMFAALGLGAESLHAAEPDPWTVRLLMAEPEEAVRKVEGAASSASVREMNEGVLRQGLRGDVRDRGWFNRSSFDVDGRGARSLVAIVQQARSLGSEIVVVLLPESSVMRANVPIEAVQCLKAALDRAFGPASPPVIDLRDTIPDALFHDNLHPKRAGRLATTRALVEAIGRLGPQGG